ARLPHRREAGADAIGDGRSEYESAALDADDDVDALAGERQREAVDRGMEPVGVLQQRGDVVEQNSGFREVGNVTDLFLQVHDVGHLVLNPLAPLGTFSVTSMSSTRAAGGPWRTARSKRSIDSRSPSAATSTRPSGRLRTQPSMPSRIAAASVK